MAGDVPSPGPADPARRGSSTAPMALYRRYRPATFAELKGQDHVTEPLRQALRSGRVHHAYLFSGPRGCGKTSSARILARSLNCEQGPTPDPCGKCASCVALAPSGPGSIDVIEIDAASHGGVDDARDLRERAFYAPVSGRFKIYIVDEAHMVTREGFNALLKLVEEPPPHLKFVFATTEPEKVIPTIRSRTHHYAFRLMPPAILRGLLEDILGSEGISYEPEVLPVVVRAGAGSARDALSVLDQLLAGSGEEGPTYERAVALLGYTDDRLLDEVAEAFAADDGAAVFRAVNRVVEGGHDPRRFAADLLDRLRDLIILDAVPDAGQTGLLDVPADRLESMRGQAAAFGRAKLARAAETINAGLVEMRGAASPRLQLELICAQVLLPRHQGQARGAAGETETSAQPGSAAADVKALIARIDRLERLLDQGRPTAPGPSRPPAPGTSPAPAPPASAPAERATSGRPAADDGPSGAATSQRPTAAAGAQPDAAVIQQRWPEILDAVKHERRVAWLLLSNATVDTLQDGVLTLRFTREGEARGFAGSGYEEDLKSVLASMFGFSPRVRAVSGAPEGPRGGGGGPAGGGAPGNGAAQPGSGGAGHSSGPDSAGQPGPDGAGQSGSGGAEQPGPAGAGQSGSAAGHRGAGGAHDRRSGGAGEPGSGGSGEPGSGAVASPDRRPGTPDDLGEAGGADPVGGRETGAARARRAAAGGRGGTSGPKARGSGPRGSFASPDEPASDDPDVQTLAGVDLVQRELGGQVIAELDNG
jgi:DNA polymerase III subunit gamma/tau